MEQRTSRIARNTLMLYIRMLITMGIGLYTGRVILNALGIEDYGIYGVVGGIVSISTLLTSSISSALGRFLTFEIGRGDKERLKMTFSTAIIVQVIIAAVIFLIVEAAGVWFLTHKMVIPIERMYAAKWVLQISLVTCIMGLLRSPFSAVIIAREKMSFFAWLTIIESAAKLLIAMLITMSPIDKLIFYSLLGLGVSISISALCVFYGRRNFDECRNIRFKYHKTLFKEIFSFAGWNFIGTSSALLRDQGSNILLNLFGGPAINAARGVSNQVVNAVTRFSENFMMALTPQITKSYANGEWDYMMKLIYRGSRFSFYILLTLSLPVLFNTEYLLTLWLKTVPQHAVLFVQLTLIYCLIESLSTTLIHAMLATGKIRKYQIVVGGVNLLNFPASYLCLKQGAIPEVVVIIAIIMSSISLFLRIYMLRGMINLSARDFTRRVILNVLVVTALSSITPWLLDEYLKGGVIEVVVASAISATTTICIIYFVGCDIYERRFVNKRIVSLFKRFQRP